MHSSTIRLLVTAASALLAQAVPHNATHLAGRQSTSKLVFCHFMIGVVSDRTTFDDDMIRAKALGIDAFALNIGTDSYTDTQLGFAYASAAANGMKVFISFDFNWYTTAQGSAVGAKIAQYASLPAQLFIGTKAFAGSFAGDGVDVAALRAAAGADFSVLDGVLNWVGWESNGANKAPSGGVTLTVAAGDSSYESTLQGKGTLRQEPVFPSDLLWYQRWVEVLALQPTFVEIITWNDYGESHYIGPLSSPHTDDGSSKWANEMGAPTGTTPWPTTSSLSPSSPPRAVTVNSGGTLYTFSAPAGAAAFAVPFKVGAQAFALLRNGATVMSATSLKLIQNVCPCGLYNFNAYVGTVPAQAADALQPDGLANFELGLKVTCAATPSLGVTPPATTAASTTVVANAAPTSPPA
ncbi:glycosyl hydrolase family 71-domain-containing protein [Mycena epipterygia]|nr:glycosyl hydrolase family 71-domain-containing protein [Mycena epipterygia]